MTYKLYMNYKEKVHSSQNFRRNGVRTTLSTYHNSTILFAFLPTLIELKIILKWKLLPQSTNLHKIFHDVKDIFKNLSLKSEYPINGGSLDNVYQHWESQMDLGPDYVVS